MISVIITSYNRMNYLVESLPSVLNQTFKDIEVIVVDDGSMDGTKAYVEFIKSRDKRVRYVREPGVGVSGARNRGIVESKGEYICFLDSDDLWLPKKLEIQFRETVSKGYYISYTDEIWIRKGRYVNPGKKHQKFGGWIFEKCVPLCIISPSSVMIKREVFSRVGLFDETFYVCEDYDLWLRICSRYPVLFINKKLIVKRGGHPGQLSATWGRDAYRVRSLLSILKSPYLTKDQRELVLKDLVRRMRILMEGFRKNERRFVSSYYEGLLKDLLGMYSAS